MADTLKEFLVGLGFKVDDSSWGRFERTITSATLQAKSLGDAIEATARTIVTKIAQAAETLEQLHYQAARSASSVQSIRAFEYAVSQLGGTVDGAAEALEAFGKRIQLDAGFEGWVRGLGVATRDAQGHLRDLAQVQAELTQKIAGSNNPIIANQYREFLGVSDLRTWNAINNPEFWKRYKEEMASGGSAGLGDAAAADSARFEKAIRETSQRLTDFATGAEAKLMKTLAEPLESLNKYLDEHKDEINDALADIAKALAKVATETTKSLADFDWKKAGKDILDTTHAVAAFIASLANFVAQMEDLNQKSKDWWITKYLNWTAGNAGGETPGGIYDPYSDPNNPASKNEDGSTGTWGAVKSWWKRTMPRILGGGSSSSNAPAPSGSMAERAFGLMDYLVKERGWTPAAAAIAAGNAQQESGINASNSSGDGGTSWGQFQWHGDRRDAMVAYAKSKGKPWSDERTQWEFFADEAERRDPMWKRQPDLSNAGPIGYNYERYGDNSTGVRVANAERWLQAYEKRQQRLARTAAPTGAPSSFSPIGSAHAGTLSWDQAAPWGGINQALPVGAGGVTNVGGDKHMTINQTNNVTVTGMSDPNSAAAAIGAHLDRSNADTARNLRGAAQ